MKKALLMAALAAAVVGGALGGGEQAVSTFTDKRDGKVYKIVEINGQTWFAENLNYAAEGSKCYEDKAGNCEKYGRLYDWNTAMKACPAGWHLATDAEWTALVNYAGGELTAGTKLKSSTGWMRHRGIPTGTNDYGFSALPGGDYDDYFNDDYFGGSWWSATEVDADYAWGRHMLYNHELAFEDDDDKTVLFSVRCMADKEAQK